MGLGWTEVRLEMVNWDYLTNAGLDDGLDLTGVRLGMG